MPMFICSRCSGIDNTVLGRNQYKETGAYVNFFADPSKTEALCCECKDPQTSGLGKPPGGVWHNQFPKVIATEEIVRARGIWPNGNNGFMHLGTFEYLREELQS